MWVSGRTRSFLLGLVLHLLACGVRWSLGMLLMQRDICCNLDKDQNLTTTAMYQFRIRKLNSISLDLITILKKKFLFSPSI